MRALDLLAGAVQEAPPGASNDVLIATVGTVIVSLIGATVAVWNSRSKPVSMTEEPSSELPSNLVGLLEQSNERFGARIDELEDERDLWMRRAYDAGWRP